MTDQLTTPMDGPQLAAPGPAGAPSDALAGFEQALVAAARTPRPASADPQVSLAFALGWQMAELLRPGLRHRSMRGDGDLPGLGSLSDSERLEISVDQIQAAIFQLTPAIQGAGLTPPAAEQGAVGNALASWAADGVSAVQALHLKLLGTLTAADFRLGKAYGLGRALADTCRKPADGATVKAQLDRYRLANLLAWLDELSTSLPTHAAHSVYTSLARWRDWADAQTAPPDSSVAVLKRQGELWRSLLSGEKRGTEMLEAGNYLEASARVASRMNAIVRQAVWRFKVVIIAVLCLVAATVALLIAGSSSDIVAGAGTLLAALGLSWRGLGGALGQLAGKLEQPLWESVLDAAIADAITIQPGNQADLRGRAALASDLAEGSRLALGASTPKEGGQAAANG